MTFERTPLLDSVSAVYVAIEAAMRPVLLPIPDDAPVTMIVLPSRRFAIAVAIVRLAVCEMRGPWGRKTRELCNSGFRLALKERRLRLTNTGSM